MTTTPFHFNNILTGNCLELFKSLPDNSIDLIITSPPYFQQRDYGTGDLGFGNEKSQSEYLTNLSDVFGECMRVVKNTGCIVFNLGDKYVEGSLSLLPYKFAILATEHHKATLINQITWAKLNPTPRQDKRKLIQATEPFFIFSKSKNYHFDLSNYLCHLDEINKTNRSKPSDKLGKQYFSLIENSALTDDQKNNAHKALKEAIILVQQGEIDGFRMKIKGVHKEAYGGMEGGRNNQIRNNGFTVIKILGNRLKKDLIECPVEITKNNPHPAVYPVYIVQELIKLLSKKNDIILDPFCGSGTTCLAAKNLHRNYLGFEINAEYASFAIERLANNDFSQELIF